MAGEPKFYLAGAETPEGQAYVAALHRLGWTPAGAAEANAHLIAAPLEARPGLIRQAAEAALPVLSALPFAPTQAEAETLVDLCAARGTLLMPAFRLRAVPVVRSLRAMIDAGKLGRIIAVKLSFPGQKRHANGPAAAVRGLHALDLLRWLLRREITDVYLEAPSDVVALFSTGLEDAAYATADASWSLPDTYPAGEHLKLEVVGEGASVRLDAARQTFAVHSASSYWSTWGSEAAVELVRAFALAVDGGDVLASPADALRAQGLVEAAYRAAAARAPIGTPWS